MTSEVKSRGSAVDRTREYLRETRIEMRKVSWPSREDTINLTSVVLVVTLAMTVYLGGLDTIYNWVFGLILQLVANLS